MRIFKSHPILKLINSYLIDSPQPSNLSYLWNFGSLLATCLVIQIVTGITLAMHYNPSVNEAFNSVEHIMRDVNNGWLIRYLHSNTASAFFFLVYLHIGRGLYYGSYKAPRTLVWTIGTFIFILMMATAFLGYVLPYGQMSLWGFLLKPQMFKYLFLFAILLLLINYFSLDLHNIKKTRLRGIYRIGPHNKEIIDILVGSLLGDAHAEKKTNGAGTRIYFYQENKHIEYILWLHKKLSDFNYCNSEIPKTSTRLGIDGKLRKIARFSTWTYTSLNWIHDIFYDHKKKIVPYNISEYLTPLSLAIWIMDDGSKSGKGLKLSRNCFSYNDCLIIVKALADNFGLKASIISAGSSNRYCIYIWKESMNHLRNIVSQYILPGMKHKIINDVSCNSKRNNNNLNCCYSNNTNNLYSVYSHKNNKNN